MQALALLGEVSEAYGGLETLAVEAALISESGDENANQRSESRVRYFYAAPDRVRYEPCGKDGIFQVADGSRLQNCFSHPHGRKQCTSIPVSEMLRLPHLFRPDSPIAGGDEAFLFQGIHERVVSAEILRQEEGCYVASVTYQPPPWAGLAVYGSAVRFWIDERNRMVMRQQGDVGHRFPTEDEVTWSRHTVLVRRMRVNETLPAETFVFTAPPDAVEETPRGCGCGIISMSGGSGFIEAHGDDRRRLEHRSQHHWEGDTLVETSKWKWRGLNLTFERRLAFSADEKELQVAERIAGPQGEVECRCKLPVA